jgi:hypothetical protein
MRSRVCASLTALLVSGAPAVQRDATPLPLLLGRAAEYVKEFERQMTNIVSDEHYVQDLVEVQMRSPSGLGNGGTATPVESRKQRRELRSDFLVVRLGPAGLPVPFRDVYEVDGHPVRDRADRLTALFIKPTEDTIAQAWRVVDEGARYNLGDVRRTVNVPVLPVVVLRAANQARFRFRDRGEATEDGVRVRLVEYTEQRRPTIVRADGERDLPARGRLWIEPATGRVVKGELVTEGAGRMTLLVRYGFDLGVGAAVPIEMRDTYVLSRMLHVNGLATYRGFRRFIVEVK